MATYREAGVNIEAGEDFVRRILPLTKTTFRREVISELGGFGGLFQFPSNQYREPVLVSGTDGVGTKLKVAVLMNRHDTIGIDLVAMCVNDLIVTGAEPLFFLDYFSTGRLDIAQAEEVVAGIAQGCREAGCALIGGETAEMPDCYPAGEYDLAGFAVGVVEKANLVDGKRITDGDVLIGLPSTGLHSNGFTLARHVLLDQGPWSMEDQLPELTASLGSTLLQPTRIYVRLVQAIVRDCAIHGIAHITGGGIIGNLPRILPPGCQARVQKRSWPVPPIFHIIQRVGSVAEDEMARVFNMGIGLILVVPPTEVERVLTHVKDQQEQGFVIGDIGERKNGQPALQYVEGSGI